MGNPPGQRAEGLHFLRVAELILSLFSLGDIAHGADETGPAAAGHFGHRQLQGKFRAVATDAFELASCTDGVASAGARVTGDVAVVAVLVGLGQQNRKVFTDHPRGRVSENSFRRRVERFDDAAGVGGDQSVPHCLHDRTDTALAILGAFLGEVGGGQQPGGGTRLANRQDDQQRPGDESPEQ